jgi:8-oxo-dGTP pyrophosphatase MutT (NUDIX family)
MQKLHNIQIEILSKLVFSPESRYTDLKPKPEMGNNTFQFHIDHLINEGLIQKSNRIYKLTMRGKQYATKIDNGKKKLSEQAINAVQVCCTREQEDKKQYLIYTRKKEPWYGCQGFLAGKIDYGEKITVAAKRELGEETGLIGDPKIVDITHTVVMNRPSGNTVSDILFFLCHVNNPKGNLVPSREGEYEWVDKREIENYVEKPFININNFLRKIEMIENFKGEVRFSEEDSEDNTF